MRNRGLGGAAGRGAAVGTFAVFVLAAFVAAFVVVAPVVAQKEDGREAWIRFAHLSPDTPAVDVYIDDKPVEALRGVSFKDVASYLPLPAGTCNVKVYPAGETPETADPLLETDMDLDGGTSHTLGVVGNIEDGSLTAKLYEDDESPPEAGNAKLRVVHAVPDVGAATVGVEGGGDLFDLPGFSNASDYAQVPAGTYTLEVKPAGTDEVALRVPDVPLSEGEVYTAFAVGQAEDGTLDAVLTPDGEPTANSRARQSAGQEEGAIEPVPDPKTGEETVPAPVGSGLGIAAPVVPLRATTSPEPPATAGRSSVAAGPSVPDTAPILDATRTPVTPVSQKTPALTVPTPDADASTTPPAVAPPDSLPAPTPAPAPDAGPLPTSPAQAPEAVPGVPLSTATPPASATPAPPATLPTPAAVPVAPVLGTAPTVPALDAVPASGVLPTSTTPSFDATPVPATAVIDGAQVLAAAQPSLSNLDMSGPGTNGQSGNQLVGNIDAGTGIGKMLPRTDGGGKHQERLPGNIGNVIVGV